MDPLTHTATGLFLSRAGMDRWTPRATAILILAANLPDCDSVSLLFGSSSYLVWHRHFTHSLIAMPLMALLAVAAVRVISRTPLRWVGAFAAALIGVASHLLLDFTNTYGIRLLLPFSNRWFHLDIAPLPDIWTWTILGLGIAGPFLSRLVGSEISSGSVRVRHYGRGGAIFALVLFALWDGGRAVLHERAVNTLSSRLYQGTAPLRVAATPAAGNPLRWGGIVETPGFYAYEMVDLAQEFDPTRAFILQKPDPGPAIAAASRTPAFQAFLQWSQYPLWRALPSDKLENGVNVEAYDLRFGSPAAPAFVARALVDGNLRVVESSFQFR
jgi:inner membrane protein